MLNHTRRKPAIAVIFLVGLILLILRKFNSSQNYPETNYPIYSGSLTVQNPQLTNELTVVSYNIRYSRNIDQAIDEFKELQSEEGLDIILLQEMEETGVEQIGRALEFNYVYIPAAIEPRYRQNTGNAILTRWPITAAEKIILPHNGLSSGMNRTATKAIIEVNDKEIPVYSIHTETKFTLPRFRENQYKAILENVDPEAELTIIGGDFNSVTSRDMAALETLYKQRNFYLASTADGHTVTKFWLQVTADHIFSRGFEIKDNGRVDDAEASDHLPIWARLGFS